MTTRDDRNPHADENGVPGTVDDIPLGFGEERPDAQPPSAAAGTGPGNKPPKESSEPGTADERELWRKQKVLIDEDEKAGLKLDGFPDEDIPEILEAMGDDAAEPLEDFPNGTSATGLWSGPEHGGFPERTD